ncbi:hypothetical protein WS70_12805 [Burkholderia mayonis]|uniref:HTH lysR-type domain-containing protein n=1 Tax=Burkholderia mayonis TaxID=1385591 RepID=A0A1B4FG16_9BURK|nr:LysR family transcriptional regulator [Burkholderia mayonis]AOJ02601.1 hypothetical protein WS70_12805 [Burkholderia mayonis]KVE41753.1 hypothetical protein WS70_13095 [Burkholderia mayonis]
MRPDPPDASTLPSLSALRTFEVSARGYSLTEAAHHPHATVGAVSRQIKMLEDELGVKLFDRKANSLSLNETDRQLVRDLSRAFAMILAATNRARHQYKTGIRLTCTPSITSHCLNSASPSSPPTPTTGSRRRSIRRRTSAISKRAKPISRSATA